MSPSLTSHDARRRDALSIDALVDRPSTRQCGKCQEAHTRCDGRDPCRHCEVRGTLCGYAWSSFGGPHTVPGAQPAAGPSTAKRRSPVPTGSIFPRSNAINGGWAIVPQGTNAPTAHPAVLSCKTCQARNTPCDGVTPVCGSCRLRRLECYLATPATAQPDRRNGNGPTMTWSARDRQALNPRSFPPSLSHALQPPVRPRAPSDAAKPSSSRASLSFMLNPKPEGKLATVKPNGRPTELKHITTATTPTHHVTPPTPVAPNMDKPMDVDQPTSPGSSSGLSRRPSRKRSASPESHYARDSPGRESVSSLGMGTLVLERRNRALSHVHSPRSSIDSHAFEPHSPRGSLDMRSSDSPTRNSMDLQSRGQPLDEVNRITPNSRPNSESARPVDPRPDTRPDPRPDNRPMDTRPIDAHRRSIDQSLASPIDPNRPRSRSKSSLSHLLDGDGYGGMKSPINTIQNTSPVHILPRPDTQRSPVHTTPPHTAPRTPSSEFGPSSVGPSPKASPTARAFPGPSPTAYGPSPTSTKPFPSPTTPFPAKSPTEPFSRPVSAESSREPPHPVHKASISTALSEMHLKSAGTSRASSPGGHGRDVFVHSAFNGANPPNPRPYPWTFGAAGENIKAEGRMANVWRHETEAGMRRREAEAELRKQDQVELQRRRSEGAKRRKLGEEDDDRRMSVVMEERRMSIVEPEPAPEDRRMSIVMDDKPEPEKPVSIEEKAVPEPERPMSIVEQLRKATGVAAKEAGRIVSSLPNPHLRPTTEIFGRARRESAPTPRWTDDKSKSPIVINDSPDVGIGDAEMDVPEPSEKLFPERNEPTPLGPFGHIWPPPVIPPDSAKKGRRQKDSEPIPVRSFITRLNLPPVPPTTQVKQTTPVDEEVKEVGPSQLSGLRSMLTTMPPPTAFGAAMQEFVSTPASKIRRNRAVVMTKTLMKDALSVLLDPNTDELLKDYVPPEKKKEEDKPDGTRRKMSVAIDSDHTSLEFRAWAKRMFSTIKTNQDKDVLAFEGKPVVVEDDIYTTIMICHSQGNHCGVEETAKLVDQEHSWVPRVLIEAFVQKCPGCPLENKLTSVAKPKKRKSVRGAVKRKPTARRKKQDAKRKSSGKEASPDESEEEGDQEEDELKESGDEAGPADVRTDPDPEPADQDQDQDQDEPEDEPDEAEEPEIESEDELVSRPSSEGRKTI